MRRAQHLQRSEGNKAFRTLLSRVDRRATPIDLEGALRYNQSREYEAEEIIAFQRVLGVAPDGEMGSDTTQAVADDQAQNILTVDGKLGPRTARRIRREIDLSEPAPSETAENNQIPDVAAEPEVVTASDPNVQESSSEHSEPAGQLAQLLEGRSHANGAAALIERARASVSVYPALVRQFIEHSPLSNDEKVAALGRVSAQLARMEFLLGTIYHENGFWEGGYTNRRGRYVGNNRGAVIDHYTANRALSWCTAFATTALRTMSGGNRQKAVTSGYRVLRPRTDSWDHQFETDESDGGAFVGARSMGRKTARNNPWLALADQLRASDAAGRPAITERFFEEQIRPQPGDLIIMRRDGASAGSFRGGESHTAVVEQVSGSVVSFIEGNKGSKATGRTFDLSQPGDAEEIVFIARPDLDTYTSDRAPAPASTSEVSEAELIAPVESINRQLIEIAEEGGWVNADAGHDDSVASVRRGPVGAGTR